jgi:mevalonate kinase
VGSVPCALIFTFDNEYSWFREKKITYKIKVTPPSFDNIFRGRRIRAKSALAVVANDKESAETRLESVSSKHSTLVQDIERLEMELKEKKKSLGVFEKEVSWLKERVQLREVQEDLLTRRLTEGWEDEDVMGVTTIGGGGGGGSSSTLADEVERVEN